jgi:hypothetical protein
LQQHQGGGFKLAERRKIRTTFLPFQFKSTTFGFPVTDKQPQYEKVRHNYVLFSIILAFFLWRRKEE